MRAGDAEIGEEERDRFGAHRAAAVSVHGQLVGRDLLLLAGLADQRGRELRALAVLHGPADDVAAVLFPYPLCGRRRRRPTLTGANGPVVAFSGT